jgi:hypothetical protein
MPSAFRLDKVRRPRKQTGKFAQISCLFLKPTQTQISIQPAASQLLLDKGYDI